LIVGNLFLTLAEFLTFAQVSLAINALAAA